jgi:hypothetical protein
MKDKHNSEPAKSQLSAFRKAARELGCEPDEKRFQDALRTVARGKPSEKPGKSHSERHAKDDET